MKSNFCFDSTNIKSTCPVCHADKFVSFPQHQADQEIKGLLIYCPNKESGCEWVGELNDIHKHIKDGKCCDIKCDKCDQTLPSTAVKSHLDTECPCYCPFCDITAEREVISSEHKEKCHKFPLTCPNNIVVDNLPHEKFDELQDEGISKTGGTFSSSNLTELQNNIRKETAQSLHIVNEHSEKTDKQNDNSQLYNIIIGRSYLTIAVLMIAILIALLLRSHYSNSELQQQITQLQEVQQYCYRLMSLSDWSTKLRVLGELSNQVAPAVVKMSNFIKKLENKENWRSSSFFAFKGGYQMHLRVNAAGNGVGEGTHVSVYLFLMKGPHDDELEQSGHWPFRGTFTIELLNQLNDSDHHMCMLQFHHHLCKGCTNRVTRFNPDVEMGELQFISHDTLLHHSNNSYHKSDLLIFRISYEHVEASYRQVAPITVKVTKFSYWLKSRKEYYSSPFFAFEGGYQMYLVVNAGGYRVGEGTHVSVYLHLMKGPHDDELEQSGHWPLRGTFTIELLNQLYDSDHHSCMVQFHHYHGNKYTERVKGISWTYANGGLGHAYFISHDTLFHHSNNSYYKNDLLIFRISYEHIEAPYQTAPITVKVTKFSYWLKSGDIWQSSPFFAFEGGYQMCLEVYAAGDGKGEGTHVSVFLYLMKGPHDDELEQSGHWPLRGTFTIEVLNQLNDSDHHKYTVKYDAFHNLHRVKDKGTTVDAMSKFISHDTLVQHNGYLKNDMLKFRISYSASSDGSDGNQ